VFLGERSPAKLGVPGALSDARWMARGTYCFYLYVFRSQFKLTPFEHKGVLQVCLFVARVYIFYWFTARIAPAAPRNDLSLMKALLEYEKIDHTVSAEAQTAFGRHLWYLGELLIALAFFDENLSSETKRNMISALKVG